MRIRISGISCACALIIGLSSMPSWAQLVIGSTTPTTTNPCAIYYDVATGTTTTLWNSVANKKVNGAAADLAHSKLYTNDAARLNVWNFGSIGTAPTAIAGMYRVTNEGTFTATGVDGLAWANNDLYAATSFGSTVFKKGIYQVNTTPDAGNHCVLTPLWLDPTAFGTNSGSLTLGGLDYNTADGKFYAVQSIDTTVTGGSFTRGLYKIDAFGDGSIVKVADFPTGRTGIDGLAIGGGKYWLTEQEAGNNRLDIYPYDPGTGTYDTTIFIPLTDATNRATGATWAPGAVPEPTMLGLAAIGTALLSGRWRGRRRQKIVVTV